MTYKWDQMGMSQATYEVEMKFDLGNSGIQHHPAMTIRVPFGYHAFDGASHQLVARETAIFVQIKGAEGLPLLAAWLLLGLVPGVPNENQASTIINHIHTYHVYPYYIRKN